MRNENSTKNKNSRHMLSREFPVSPGLGLEVLLLLGPRFNWSELVMQAAWCNNNNNRYVHPIRNILFKIKEKKFSWAI